MCRNIFIIKLFLRKDHTKLKLKVVNLSICSPYIHNFVNMYVI